MSPNCWLLFSLLLVCVAASLAAEPQKIAFNAVDGYRIHADYYATESKTKTARPMVILVHGATSDRKVWQPLAEKLAERGMATLALDLRGHGESATSETRKLADTGDESLFAAMRDDLLGAYDWLAAQPNVDRARFAIVGADSGASIAIAYAIADRSVDAIVCLSPSLNLAGYDTRGDLRQITGRKIMLAASNRDYASVPDLAALCDHATVRLYADATSGAGLLTTAEKCVPDVTEWLNATLGPPGKGPVVFASIKAAVYHPADSEWIRQISPSNLRHFSSAAEAEARGLRLTRSKQAPGDGKPARNSRGGQSSSRPARKP